MSTLLVILEYYFNGSDLPSSCYFAYLTIPLSFFFKKKKSPPSKHHIPAKKNQSDKLMNALMPRMGA